MAAAMLMLEDSTADGTPQRRAGRATAVGVPDIVAVGPATAAAGLAAEVVVIAEVEAEVAEVTEEVEVEVAIASGIVRIKVGSTKILKSC